MFKENFTKLCKKKGESPTVVCQKIGLSNAAYSTWTDNTIPRNSTLIKIADYFGVTPESLVEEQKQKPINGDDELTEYLEELKTRPEMRMLFSLAKGATKEDVERAVAIIEALRKSSGNE